MQTPAEKYLVKKIITFLRNFPKSAKHNILNIGAGENMVIEDSLFREGIDFICDRVDVTKNKIPTKNYIGKVFCCSVESMKGLESNHYDVVFANYLLEHVQHLDKTAFEIQRVLKTGGIFVTSVPNPLAPEFVFSRHTPLWVHKKIRNKESWKTRYAFSSIDNLVIIFERAGFKTTEIEYKSFIEGYLERFFLLNKIAHLYDRILDLFKLKRIMGNVGITFLKT